MDEATDKPIESADGFSSSSRDALVVESDKERPVLAKMEKERSARLKAGEASGITDQFDKPELYESQAAVREIGLDSTVEEHWSRFSNERQRLTELSESRIKDPAERKQFQQDMRLLEGRMDRLQELYKKQYEQQGRSPEEAQEMASKQSQDQVSETLKQVGRVLEAEGDKPLKQSERIMVAEEILHHAADPTTVDQGSHHGTCHVTTVESRLYTRSPATVAQMVADVALKGQYKSVGEPEVTVTLDKDSLTPDCEAENNNYPTGSDRSFASQLFQATALNVSWELYNQHQDPHTDFHYVQLHDTAVIVEDSKDPQKEATTKDANAVSDDEVVELSNQITGKDEKRFLLRHGRPEDEKFTDVDSVETLCERLKEMKEKGELPAIVKVDCSNEPLFSDSGGGDAGGSGDWHFVTVTDYNPETGKVDLDNQWGEENDHFGDRALDINTVFNLMKDPAHQDPEEGVPDRGL